MKPGQASKTAVLVCMGRAAAHERTIAPKFCDPTALTLLPAEARARVERYRRGGAQDGFRDRMEYEYIKAQETVMVGGTVAIDEAIRGRGPVRQLVILGAGLDGRAWRMSELADAVVFEVDHPSTQREKRERSAALTKHAREIRFVPVDFTRDSLDDALEKAGHDRAVATTWVWEGVIPYLTRAEVEATLDVIARRSSRGSRVVLAYQRRALSRWLVGWIVSRLGEPFRSTFTPREMGALVERRGFVVRSDDDMVVLDAAAGIDASRLGFWVRAGRIMVADSSA